MNALVKGITLPNAGRALVGGTVYPNYTVIANSVVLVKGDAVKSSTGFITNASVTTAALAGIVETVCDANGIPVTPDSGTADTWTVASDNQTNALKYAIIDESPFTIYSFKSNATLGTTTGSNLRNYYADMADSTQISESSTTTTAKVLRLLGPDPDNTARVLATINKPECLRN